VPASAGAAAPPFAAGEAIAGEVVYYPSATPLRALLATRAPGRDALGWPALPDGLGAALASYDAAIAQQPWIEAWPLAASGVSVERFAPHHLALVDRDGLALPFDARQTEELLPALGLGPISAIMLWDGRFATLLAADTAIGRWHAGEWAP
jgi:hypothetical protein